MAWFKNAVQLAVKWGPKLVAAVAGLEELNRRFPDAPGKAASLARDVAGRLQAARAKQSATGRVRHVLEIVRDAVDAMELERSGEPAFLDRAAVWRRRAADLDTAVRLADAQQGKRRKELLTSIKGRTDVLAEEVINELATTTEIAATGDAPDELSAAAAD